MDQNQQLIFYLNFRLINWQCDRAGERSRHRRCLHLIKVPPGCITFQMHWIFCVSLLGGKMRRANMLFDSIYDDVGIWSVVFWARLFIHVVFVFPAENAFEIMGPVSPADHLHIIFYLWIGLLCKFMIFSFQNITAARTLHACCPRWNRTQHENKRTMFSFLRSKIYLLPANG